MNRAEVLEAITLAVDGIPGAGCDTIGDTVLVVLPVPGLALKVRLTGTKADTMGTLHLVLIPDRRELGWCNLPSWVTGHPGSSERGAARIRRDVQQLVQRAVVGAPRRHARDEASTRGHRVGSWLPRDEYQAALGVAVTTGVSLSELLRRGLALVVEQANRADEIGMAEPGKERHLRGALRLVTAANPEWPDDMAAAANIGHPLDALKALRRCIRGPRAQAAAQLLGVDWVLNPDA